MIAIAWSQPGEPPAPRLTMRRIIEDVARRYGITVEQLTGPQRARKVAWPRQEVMYRAHRELGASTPQIGLALGGRDHTTVMYGIKEHEKRMSMGDGK